MNLLFYKIDKKRCRCQWKEEFSIPKPKKSKRNQRIRKATLEYPIGKIYSEKFEISYKKNLSSKAKFILNTFQKKYIYYAIDDILYILKSTPNERNNLLEIIYSPIISLQNNFSVNFLDIWIDAIYIQEIIKKNRFLTNKTKNLKNNHLITIRLFYRIPLQKKASFMENNLNQFF